MRSSTRTASPKKKRKREESPHNSAAETPSSDGNIFQRAAQLKRRVWLLIVSKQKHYSEVLSLLVVKENITESVFLTQIRRWLLYKTHVLASLFYPRYWRSKMAYRIYSNVVLIRRRCLLKNWTCQRNLFF